MMSARHSNQRTPMAESNSLLNSPDARLEFFPRLRKTLTRQWLAEHSRDAGEAHLLFQWLSRFGETEYAREMVFAIERALSRLENVPGYRELSSGLKASGAGFWSTLGHLSLAAFFQDVEWEVEIEHRTPRATDSGPIDLLVRWKGQELALEIKSVSDLASGWTPDQLEAYYADTPRFLRYIREHPMLEPVLLRTREQITRLVGSRARKVKGKVRGVPLVLALDCSSSLEDTLLKDSLAPSSDFTVDAVVTFSVGGTDLYPDNRTIVKGGTWLETPLGNAFRCCWEGADRRKALLRDEAERITRLLQSKYDPEAVLVFGSVAQGLVREDSDLDMVIIKRTEQPYSQRISEVLALARPSVRADIFVYTPEEFERLEEQGDFFITREVLPTCERLYERPKTMA